TGPPAMGGGSARSSRAVRTQRSAWDSSVSAAGAARGSDCKNRTTRLVRGPPEPADRPASVSSMRGRSFGATDRQVEGKSVTSACTCPHRVAPRGEGGAPRKSARRGVKREPRLHPDGLPRSRGRQQSSAYALLESSAGVWLPKGE